MSTIACFKFSILNIFPSDTTLLTWIYSELLITSRASATCDITPLSSIRDTLPASFPSIILSI